MEDLKQAPVKGYLQGRDVVSIEQRHATMHLIDGRVALIENKHGVTVNGEVTRHTCDLIERRIVGSYSWVINREEDYSIALVETYNELNSREKLRRVAVVSYRKLTDVVAGIEAKLCKKEFSIFDSVEAALAWANSTSDD